MSEIEQIILLLTSIDKRLEKLCKKTPRKKRKITDNPDDWVFLQEALKRLGISKSTLYRWRDDDLVRWEKKKGTVYYYLPDLIRNKNRFMK